MMLKIWTRGLLFGILLLAAQNAAAIDTLYVLQIGDGSASLSTSAAAVIIQKFDASNGSSTGSIALPTAVSGANQPLTVRGSSTSEGHLALSTDGNYLTLGGYAAVPGTVEVARTDAATTGRVLGRIPVSTGIPDTSTVLSDAYDGLAGGDGSIRSVVSTDGSEFWTAGTRGFGAPSGSDGVRYATYGSTTSTSVENFPDGQSNTRIVNITGGQLYMGTGSASAGTSSAVVGINTIGTGLPTTSGQSAAPYVDTSVTGSGTASPYAFWFKDANTVYIADDRAVASGGGIQKWIFDSGSSTWSLDYILSSGASGARGLIGTVVGADTVLYATNAESASKLITITDTGMGSIPTTLATAPANTAFRGVAFVPGAAGLAGDYNDDGHVNAADYVTWRKDPASFGGAGGYDTWRQNFNNPPGSGSNLGSATAVPEPASAVLLLFGSAALLWRRRAA